MTTFTNVTAVQFLNGTTIRITWSNANGPQATDKNLVTNNTWSKFYVTDGASGQKDFIYQDGLSDIQVKNATDTFFLSLKNDKSRFSIDFNKIAAEGGGLVRAFTLKFIGIGDIRVGRQLKEDVQIHMHDEPQYLKLVDAGSPKKYAYACEFVKSFK